MKKRKKLNKRAIRTLAPLCITLIIVFTIYFSYKLIFKRNFTDSFLETIQTNTYASITKYAIYGIHLNIEGKITFQTEPKDISLVLTNGKEEITVPWDFSKKENTYTFTTSKYINEGIVLENLPINTYYLMIKTLETNQDHQEETKYYSVENKTDYSNIEYYTLTKDNKNNRINIEWNTYEECPTLRFKIKETTLPKEVYDITIDPGHDASDPGKAVCLNGNNIYNPSSNYCQNGGTLYKESDINLAISLTLKEKLENLGYKVIMTRNTENDYVNIYDPMGSATMANDTKSKFSIAIHHNSSGVDGGVNYLKGLEIYIANDTNLDFAEILVKNIKEKTNTIGSYKSLYKISDGIYQRFFEESEIENDYWTTDMIYYYYIREVGGISTHAAQDQERKGYPKNEHYNSNNTAEPYLFELGYIDNLQDLNNIINNKEGYAEGIANALKEYLENEKSN